MFKFKIFVLIATMLLSTGVANKGYHKAMDRFFPLEYEELLEKYSEKEGLDKYFVMAVINAESRFDPRAHSGVAKGLMQITDETAMWICHKMGIKYYHDMAYDPETNVKMGCWYLKYLINKYDNIDTALAAYNAGFGNVDKWLADPEYSEDGETLKKIPFSETSRYVKRVRRMVGIYQKAY